MVKITWNEGKISKFEDLQPHLAFSGRAYKIYITQYATLCMPTQRMLQRWRIWRQRMEHHSIWSTSEIMGFWSKWCNLLLLLGILQLMFIHCACYPSSVLRQAKSFRILINMSKISIRMVSVNGKRPKCLLRALFIADTRKSWKIFCGSNIGSNSVRRKKGRYFAIFKATKPLSNLSMFQEAQYFTCKRKVTSRKFCFPRPWAKKWASISLRWAIYHKLKFRIERKFRFC